MAVRFFIYPALPRHIDLITLGVHHYTNARASPAHPRHQHWPLTAPDGSTELHSHYSPAVPRSIALSSIMLGGYRLPE